MKIFKRFFIQIGQVFALILVLMGCDEETQALEYQDLVVADAYAQFESPIVSFQAGTEIYDLNFNAINGSGYPLDDVTIYSSFTSGGVSSNEVVLKSYSIDNSILVNRITDSFTYEELKEGIIFEENPLPDSDFDLVVGASWVLRYEATSTSGDVIDFGSVTVAVLSPYAGLYTVVNSDYWRIGVQSTLADWTGSVRFINSLSDSTFAYTDAWGPFSNEEYGVEGEMIFDLNNDLTFTVTDDPSQLFFSGDDMLTCQEDGTSFTNVPCTGSNVLIPDNVDGAHTIILTYGYSTDGGVREFYEELVKIVD